MNARLLVELQGTGLATVVFVVSQTGIDGCFQSLELFVDALFLQWTYRTVDDVACNEYHVRFLVVNQVYPAMYLVALVVVADVQVAQQNGLDGLGHLVGCDGQLLAHFVLVVQVTIDEQAEHEDADAANRPPVII